MSGAPTECRQRTNSASPPRLVPHRGAGAGHDLHRDRDVVRISDLYPVLGFGSVERTHAERDHIHGAPGHRAAIMLGHHGFHVDRVDPIVRGASVGLLVRTDERAVLDARHVLGVRRAPERVHLARQPREGALVHQKCCQAPPFVIAAVAPHHLVGCGERGDIFDPVDDCGVRRRGGVPGHGGGCHGIPYLPWRVFVARVGCGGAGLCAGGCHRG